MAPARSYTSLPKRTTLTYKQRLQVCEHARANPSLRMAALADWATREFRLPKEPSESSIRKICANEAQWLDALAGAGDDGMRKKSHVQAPEVEAALLEWIAQRPRGEGRIKGREIQEKADDLADALGFADGKRPKFSKGWLAGFEERYKINGKGSSRGKTSAAPSSRKRPSLSDPIPTRIVLTYKQRDELCEHARLNPTLNHTQLAAWATTKFHLRKYISNHAVGRILKRADEWKSVPTREARHMRHARSVASPELDMLLANWVAKKRERRVKITGKDITDRARAIADELELPECELPKFSKGWLQSFMTRHKFTKTRNIARARQPRAGAPSGEHASASENEDDDLSDAYEYDDHSADERGFENVSHEDGELDRFDHYEQAGPVRKKSRVAHLLN